MLTSIEFKDFSGVPHLEGTNCAKKHKNKFKFSLEKPNVILGANGDGKSALVQAIALRFLAWYTNESAITDNYIGESEAKGFWREVSRWRGEYEYLPGMTCETDNAPALFYRPGHLPGNEADVTHAMMMGFFEEAKAYGLATQNKSSGQQSQAMLERIIKMLEGEPGPTKYPFKNWRYGKELQDLSSRSWTGDYDHKGEHLKKMFAGTQGGIPLILMDEPEQSLDARAEMSMWSKIAAADCSRVQIIVATHSLYPILYPERFNIIEASKGYMAEVKAMMG